MKNRIHYRDTLSSVLSSMPEVTSIHTFGSDYDNTADEFSDIDLVVVSSDLRSTQNHYRNVISGISPIIGSWFAENNEDRFMETMALKDFGLYHKIDLAVTGNINKCDDFGPFRCLYEKSQAPSGSESKLIPRPIIQDANFMMTMHLFLIPNLTKSISRNTFTRYLIWSGAVQNLLTLLYEKSTNWKESLGWKNLNRPQRSELFRLINPEDRAALERVLPLNNELVLSKSVREMFLFYVNLSNQKASALKQTLNNEFAEYALSFLNTELLKHEEKDD